MTQNTFKVNRNALRLFGAAALCFATSQVKAAPETLGGGTVATAASGPAPSFGIGGPGMVLVKNWKFGANGTIKNYADMNENFMYHDQFGQISNGGGNYGALMVAPDAANALDGQPIEGVNSPPVREWTADSLKTYLTGIDGATLVEPKRHNAGNGSFVAKWKLPKGGSLLGQDIVWETRVRMVTPKYFWFAIWTAGNKWLWRDGAQGAEVDVVESFGYDNGCDNCTNFDGRFWHVGSVATPSKDTVHYDDWSRSMASRGITAYDATQYHTWTWHYKKDNTYTVYVDGIPVQSGSDYYWTYGNKATDEPVELFFLFDGSWGHTQIGSVNKPLPTSDFTGKFYEWNYSRVYLSHPAAPVAAAPFKGPHTLPSTLQAEDFDAGGQTVSYYYISGTANAYRPQDVVSLEAIKDNGDGYAVGSARAGQYLKYTVNAAKAGTYPVAFRVAAATDTGRFHLEDARGVHVSGSIAVPNTGAAQTWATVNGSVTLPAGSQTLTLVQDAPGFSLNWMTFGEARPAGALLNGNYKLLNKSNGEALDLDTAKGITQLYKYLGYGNQQWTLQNLGDGVYQISSLKSGKALSVKDGAKEAGSAVAVADYQALPTEQWTLVAANGGYKIKNVGSGRVLEAVTPGQIAIADEADKPTQIWDVSPA